MSHSGSPRLSLCHAYVFSLMPLTHLRLWRLVLAGLRYAQFSTRFVSLLSLTRLDVILVLYFYDSYACLYLYLPYLYIYWVGDGTIPIFNLLCNHPSVVT